MKTPSKRLLFFSLSLLLMVWACTQVPFTDRKQVTGIYDTQQVLAMSYQSYKHVLDSAVLSQDKEKVDMIKRVGERIEAAAVKILTDRGQADVLNGFEWDYNLIDNDTLVNAWCMPGGKVAFYTAILPICQNDEGVAVVMGHEIAHAIAKHGQERMNQAALQQQAMGLTGAAIGADPGLAEQLVYYGIGYGSQFGMLAYSRTHESEADEIGLYLMAAAGYDPRVAPEFWERMSGGGGQEPPEFMSTHPNHSTRIQKLNELIPKAMEYYPGDK